MTDSIFTKIISREVPATIRYEDDDFIAFDDIHPHAPVHILVVTKVPYETLEAVSDADERTHARLLLTARFVAKQAGIDSNYRLVMNVGKDVQAVHHLHLHVLGGWDNLHSVRDQRFG